MKRYALLALLFSGLSLSAQTRCEADIAGFRFHTVYIIGNHTNGVAWAYKHLAEETCLTPTADPSQADAILEIALEESAAHPAKANDPHPAVAAGTVTEVVAEAGTAAKAVDKWISTQWYDAKVSLYTNQHKIIWKSENQKRDWLGATWPEKLRLGTNSPVCKVEAWNRPRYKNYRHWASTHCGVLFDPLVAIDLKSGKRAEEDQVMLENAREAAQKKP